MILLNDVVEVFDLTDLNASVTGVPLCSMALPRERDAAFRSRLAVNRPGADVQTPFTFT